jgi:hypothetical protein
MRRANRCLLAYVLLFLALLLFVQNRAAREGEAARQHAYQAWLMAEQARIETEAARWSLQQARAENARLRAENRELRAERTAPGGQNSLFPVTLRGNAAPLPTALP